MSRSKSMTAAILLQDGGASNGWRHGHGSDIVVSRHGCDDRDSSLTLGERLSGSLAVRYNHGSDLFRNSKWR